jgi:competence protein ComGC
LQISARPSKIDQKAFTGGLAGMLVVVAAIEVVARLIVPNAYEQSASFHRAHG